MKKKVEHLKQDRRDSIDRQYLAGGHEHNGGIRNGNKFLLYFFNIAV